MTVRILVGDCREQLRTLADASVQACVTDPPYELGFMGRKWDQTGVAFSAATWTEVLRVLKPGAHLLAFSGTRTYHRMVCAIEDAGFEIRDQIGWLFGSGFPKSLNLDGDWAGWGTALKPAWEPIVMARKPLRGTVAANMAEHQCGALNIQGSRIESAAGDEPFQWSQPRGGIWKTDPEAQAQAQALGRWPANVIHDGSEEVLEAFPESDGQSGSVTGNEPSECHNGVYSGPRERQPFAARGDAGSAARFFYCAKADRADRDDGLSHLALREAGIKNDSGRGFSERDPHAKIMRHNNHPTVKPTELMRYLCRLVTPPGGTVLDPFMGSGSTERGAFLEGFDFIGIEQDPAYVEIARERIRAIAPLLFAEVA